MGKKIGVLILHGVGIQEAGYSKSVEKNVNKLLEREGYKTEQVKYQEVLYADIYGKQQKERSKYLTNTSAYWQLVSRFFRWLLIFVLSDAVSYRARYKRVHERISENINDLQQNLSDSAPIVIVAHSMGVIAISDYIYDLEEERAVKSNFTKINNLKAMITLGCNIPLFEMGHENTVSFKRPKSDEDKKEFVWTNYYSPFDVLGYRLNKYYAKKPNFPIVDIKIYAGGILTKWNLLSHLCYWSHNKVHKHIANVIIAHS